MPGRFEHGRQVFDVTGLQLRESERHGLSQAACVNQSRELLGESFVLSELLLLQVFLPFLNGRKCRLGQPLTSGVNAHWPPPFTGVNTQRICPRPMVALPPICRVSGPFANRSSNPAGVMSSPLRPNTRSHCTMPAKIVSAGSDSSVQRAPVATVLVSSSMRTRVWTSVPVSQRKSKAVSGRTTNRLLNCSCQAASSAKTHAAIFSPQAVA